MSINYRTIIQQRNKGDKQMKKSLILVLTILLMSVYAFSEVKVGIVNAQEIFQKTKRGAEIQKRLESLQQQKTAELKKLQEDIQRLEKEVMSPALNEATREKKSLELQTKRTDLKRKYEDAQRDFQMQSQKLLAELEKELIPLIENVGKAKGFSIIFDRQRSGIVYYDPTIDITKDVITAIDAKTK